MNPATKPVRLAALALLIGVAGCEATTFQKTPLAETSCDRQLVGDWFTVPDPGSKEAAGEGELRIDKGCKLIAIDHKKDKSGADATQTSDPTQLHVGRDGAQGYLWVNAVWAFRFARSDASPPAGDITLLRYDIQGDNLNLSLTDDRAIAHRIVDGDLDGDLIKTDGKLFNRMTGSITPEQLRNKIAFSNKPARFVRHDAGAAK